jgi:sulfotransferase family protein
VRPRPSRRDPLRFAPVFILASARSCSSVVTAMLGQHPDLFGMPELKLFLFRTIGELDASLPAEARREGFAHRSPGLVRAVAELEHGGQRKADLFTAIAWLDARAHWTGAQVLDLLLERVSPRIAVEKSPEQVYSRASIARMARAYPRARYIHLTRHPVPTIRSMNEHLQGSVPDARDLDFTDHCARAWLAANRVIDSAMSKLAPERGLRIRVEDVLDGSTLALCAAATWLGIRSDDAAVAAMQHPERSPFARFAARSSGVGGGYDPKFLADPRPRRIEGPNTLDAPVDWQIDFAIWSDIQRAAESLGYPA